MKCLKEFILEGEKMKWLNQAYLLNHQMERDIVVVQDFEVYIELKD